MARRTGKRVGLDTGMRMAGWRSCGGCTLDDGSFWGPLAQGPAKPAASRGSTPAAEGAQTMVVSPYPSAPPVPVIPEIETQLGASLARIVADRGYRRTFRPRSPIASMVSILFACRKSYVFSCAASKSTVTSSRSSSGFRLRMDQASLRPLTKLRVGNIVQAFVERTFAANGRVRPEAGLRDLRHERAGSTRKRSSAELFGWPIRGLPDMQGRRLPKHFDEGVIVGRLTARRPRRGTQEVRHRAVLLR